MKLLPPFTLLFFVSLFAPITLAAPLPVRSGSPNVSTTSLDSVIKGMRFPFQYHSHAKPSSSSSSKRSLIPFAMRHPSYPINRAPLVVKPGASLGMAVETGDDNKSHHHHDHHDHPGHSHEDEPSAIEVDKAGTSWKYKADMDYWEPVGKIRASSDIAAEDKQVTK